MRLYGCLGQLAEAGVDAVDDLAAGNDIADGMVGPRTVRG